MKASKNLIEVVRSEIYLQKNNVIFLVVVSAHHFNTKTVFVLFVLSLTYTSSTRCLL